jgi:hypothetical protein
MKLLVMHFSPVSYNFIPLLSKYSPEHPVLKYPHSMFLPHCQRPSFTTIQNQRQNYNFIDLNFYIFVQQTGSQKTQN